MLSPFKFQQFLNLGMNQGFKKALTTVRDYPSIIMLPAFSIWTYGSIEKGSCQYCQTSHQKIGLSFLNSFLNGFYTLCISAIASSILLTQYPVIFGDLNELTLIAISSLPLIVLSIILMSVVACMDKCSCCSCSCCCDCLFPMTERTAFGHQEEEPTEIALVETNPLLASPNNQTTANPTTSDATDIKIQVEATETTQV
jgi:hypothetical protein